MLRREKYWPEASLWHVCAVVQSYPPQWDLEPSFISQDYWSIIWGYTHTQQSSLETIDVRKINGGFHPEHVHSQVNIQWDAIPGKCVHRMMLEIASRPKNVSAARPIHTPAHFLHYAKRNTHLIQKWRIYYDLALEKACERRSVALLLLLLPRQSGSSPEQVPYWNGREVWKSYTLFFALLFSCQSFHWGS